MDKIILKACLSTLAAIAALFVFMLVTLVAVYPETMMKITYDLGMETSCIWFAERSYTRHKDFESIERATTVAIAEGRYAKIVACGEKMVEHQDFESACHARDLKTKEQYEGKTIVLDGETVSLVEVIGSYEQYLYTQICMAKYELGDKGEALASATEWTEGFPRNNALAVLYVSAMDDKDTEFANSVALKIEERRNAYPEDSSEAKYIDKLLAQQEN